MGEKTPDLLRKSKQTAERVGGSFRFDFNAVTGILEERVINNQGEYVSADTVRENNEPKKKRKKVPATVEPPEISEIKEDEKPVTGAENKEEVNVKEELASELNNEPTKSGGPISLDDASKNQKVETEEEKKARELQELNAAREQYVKYLNNLVECFKKLLEAEKLTDIFESLEEEVVKGLNIGTKKDNFKSDFGKLKNYCKAEGKGDPDNNNEIEKEVREISGKATRLLEAFEAEALAWIENKQKKEQTKKKDVRKKIQAENQKTSEKDFITIEDLQKKTAEKQKNGVENPKIKKPEEKKEEVLDLEEARLLK